MYFYSSLIIYFCYILVYLNPFFLYFPINYFLFKHWIKYISPFLMNLKILKKKVENHFKFGKFSKISDTLIVMTF